MDGGQIEGTGRDIKVALAGCTCINLRTAARATTRLYDEMLAPSGVRITQLATLAAVAFYGPFTMKELAKALVMDRTTLTSDLKPLVAKGFVEITPGHDRRTRVITITEGGRAAIEQAMPMWQQAQDKIGGGLGAARLNTLLGALREVVSLAQAE